MTTGDEGKAMKLSYEQRKLYECKVCGNVPDDDGILSHGRGCYVISEDGGGEEFVEMKELEGKVELPELPEGVSLPLYAVDNHFGDMYRLGARTWTSSQAKFLVDLINAVYHPTNGLKQQLSDLAKENAELKLQLLQETGKDEHGAYTDEYDPQFNNQQLGE